MAAHSIETIVDWLVDGARAAERAEELVQHLCEALVESGMPLWRVGVFVRTLHPDVLGRGFIWRAGTDVIVGDANFSILDSSQYLTSPLSAMFASRKPVRHRIADDEGLDASRFLRELQSEGVTDYIAIPLLFTDGSCHAATWSTKQRGGFTDAQLGALHAITPALARVAEIRALRRTAVNLLDTYVGNHAGERILAGQIRRGHTAALDAAIWLSDMRGFTALSDSVAPDIVVEVLNRYFDCQVPAIVDQGGEVLKFMGDGLLAIFPVERGREDAPDVCARALAAAREASRRVARLSDAESDSPGSSLRFAVALHIGQVLYGNIGGGNRLDFTCIGPAVNLAARIERLAAMLGRTIVASADFARHQADEWERVGEFTVPGIAATQTVFGMPDEASRSAPHGAH